MTRSWMAVALACAALAQPALGAEAHSARQAEVARRGADVMPFSLEATQHVFTKRRDGGVQRVVARDRRDAGQVRHVRMHLREIRSQFLKGDFSGPEHIHGAQMPGLATLQEAPHGAIAISYRDVPAGAELTYRTRDAKLVAALHEWFDAQVADHGKDAMAGHDHQHHHQHK